MEDSVGLVTTPFWPWVQVVRAYAQASDAAALRHDLGAGAADIAMVVPAVRDRLPDLPTPPQIEPEAARSGCSTAWRPSCGRRPPAGRCC